MLKKILVVDDEKSILSAISRTFIDTEYEVFLGCGGKEGLRIVEEEKDIAVVISDMRMPEMDGIEFLKKVHEANSDAICMIISGYSDLESVMSAINKAHIWRFITKPWNSVELILAASNAFELYEQKKKTRELMNEIEDKNRMLEEINSDLEAKVYQRTCELQDRNELLDMIVNGSSLCDVIDKTEKVVSRYMNGLKVRIFPAFGETECAASMQENVKHIKERIFSDGGKVDERDVAGIELTYAGMRLGALIVEKDKPDKILSLSEETESILSILGISLSQHKMLNDMPGLLSDLDKEQ